MDEKDFSIFSILPPYNNLHAHIKDKNGVANYIKVAFNSCFNRKVGYRF